MGGSHPNAESSAFSGGEESTSTARDTSIPPGQSDRRAVVDQAREAWIRRLIDPSRRNNLLYYRELKIGTLDLTAADPAAKRALLVGESVPLGRLLDDEVRSAGQAQEIRHRALANLEEKGLDTLMLAIGMATWTPADEGRPPESPVLLVRLAIEQRGADRRVPSLRRTGDIQANLVLLHFLEAEHGVSLTAETLLAQDGDDEDEESFEPEPVFARLIGAARDVKGFAIIPRVVLGNYSFQKMAMVKDLRERSTELAAHEVIAAIAGFSGARAEVAARRQSADVTSLDRTPPDAEFLIRDADASQQSAIVAALGGQDGVIHGPPGTGGSSS